MGQADYHAFWASLATVALEVHQNGLDLVCCGVCRPEQVAEQPEYLFGAFSGVDLLVLSCDDSTYRLRRRPGGFQAARREKQISRCRNSANNQQRHSLLDNVVRRRGKLHRRGDGIARLTARE
jgi:hypothetical protein